MTRVLSLLVFCVLACQICHAKPTEVLQNPRSLSPVQDQQAIPALVTVADNKREQRSPEYGFFNDDYSDPEADVADERRFKHHKHHHRPGGCNEYPCGGYPGYPPSEGYPPSGGYPQGGSSGSFATASAGSFANGKPSEGQSHANAQSASFNFGPYSASFSVAESSSGGQRF